MTTADSDQTSSGPRMQRPYDDNRGTVAIIGALTLVAGIFLLSLSIPDFSVLPLALGAIATAFGVLVVVDFLVHRYWSQIHDASDDGGVPDVAWLILGIGIAALVFTALSIWASEVWEISWLAAVGVAVGVFGVGLLSVVANRLSVHGAVAWLVVGLALSLLGPVLALVLNAGWAWIIGVLGLVLGLMSYQLGLRSVLPDTAESGTPSSAYRTVSIAAGIVLTVGIGLTVIGVYGAGERWLPWVGIGAYLVVLGLLTLGVSWPGYGLRPFGRHALGIAGLVFFLVGFFFLARSGLATSSTVVSLFVAVLLALFGAFLVWRGEGIFLAVVFGFLVVWSLADRTVDAAEPADELDAGTEVAGYVVAMGDSYISGEGARQFYEGTDQKGPDRNECRRAPTAYSNLYAKGDFVGAGDERPERSLVFLACSGAKTRDVIVAGTYDSDGTLVEETPDDDPGQYGDELQVDALEKWLAENPDETVDVVLVSIGGNDVGFGEVARGCVLPGSCSERREAWLQNVETLGPSLEATYLNIKEQVSDAPVIVIPYPMLLAEEACSNSPLEQSEHDFLIEFITVLNEQIKVSAARSGVHYLDEAMFAFMPEDESGNAEAGDGQRICDSEGEGMNVIALQATDGPFHERVLPSAWGHNSMHPTALGHQLTADAVGPLIDEIIAGEEPNPDPQDDVRLEVRGVRQIETQLVNVDQLNLPDGLVEQLPQQDAQTLAFSSRTLVIDPDPPTDDGQPTYPIPIGDAAVEGDSPVWHRGSDGEWTAYDVATGDDAASPDGQEFSAAIVAGTLSVNAPRPAEGASHWIAFVDRSGAWQLRELDFCSTADRCENNFDAWLDSQSRNAVQDALPRLLLLVFGGWMIALWLRPDLRLDSFRQPRRDSGGSGGAPVRGRARDEEAPSLDASREIGADEALMPTNSEVSASQSAAADS